MGQTLSEPVVDKVFAPNAWSPPRTVHINPLVRLATVACNGLSNVSENLIRLRLLIFIDGRNHKAAMVTPSSLASPRCKDGASAWKTPMQPS